MKLTSIEVHPSNSSDVAVLSFRDPVRVNPYNVKSIFGLDAEEIIPRYYGVSGNSDSKYYSLSLEKRDIVIRIELNPRFNLNESYSDLRDAFYKKIASSRTGLLELKFKNGAEIIASISGFVSKFESPHFTKTPEIQLTIKCNEPMLKAPIPTIVDISSLSPALTTITDIKSTAPHGFKFSLIFASARTTLILTPNDTSWTFQVTPVGGFLSDDVLHFSSELNNKYLYLIRAGATIHLADVISPNSIWPIIFPGANVFAFTTPAGLTWSAISYYSTYWGV